MEETMRKNKISDYIDKVFHIISDSAYVFHVSNINNIDYIVDVYEHDEDEHITIVSTFIVYTNGSIEYSHLVAL